MFLDRLKQSNELLLKTAVTFHQKMEISPDTYIVDMDSLLNNAKQIATKAKKHNIKLFFMLKQIGRNPHIAKELVSLGYDGAVTVDFKEAEIMMKHNIPLSHVGHLVQIPKMHLEKIIDYGVQYITVYSIEKAIEINEIAKSLNKSQKILIKIYDNDDMMYSVQESGFFINNLGDVLERIKLLENTVISGVTSFPCYLFNGEEFESTQNIKTIKKAINIFNEHGIHPELINTPSATCSEVIDLMIKDGSNCGEPGHGLTGTTPAHAKKELTEKISVLYLSEISHNFKDKAYCYGGGFYRRSHMENALCVLENGNEKQVTILKTDSDIIDYHFVLDQELPVSSTVIMAFRFQVFVTRSDVVLIEGIQSGKPKIIGRYNSLGDEK